MRRLSTCHDPLGSAAPGPAVGFSKTAAAAGALATLLLSSPGRAGSWAEYFHNTLHNRLDAAPLPVPAATPAEALRGELARLYGQDPGALACADLAQLSSTSCAKDKALCISYQQVFQSSVTGIGEAGVGAWARGGVSYQRGMYYGVYYGVEAAASVTNVLALYECLAQRSRREQIALPTRFYTIVFSQLESARNNLSFDLDLSAFAASLGANAARAQATFSLDIARYVEAAHYETLPRDSAAALRFQLSNKRVEIVALPEHDWEFAIQLHDPGLASLPAHLVTESDNYPCTLGELSPTRTAELRCSGRMPAVEDTSPRPATLELQSSPVPLRVPLFVRFGLEHYALDCTRRGAVVGCKVAAKSPASLFLQPVCGGFFDDNPPRSAVTFPGSPSSAGVHEATLVFDDATACKDTSLTSMEIWSTPSGGGAALVSTPVGPEAQGVLPTTTAIPAP